jgi:hypothetical protein
VQLGLRGPQREVALEQLHAVPNALELRRVELLRLHQHVFPHADLAEVVEERGDSELHHRIRAEAHRGVRPGRTAFTISARRPASSATRNECPDVVGSRTSIAVTDAFTKPSKRS